MPCSWHMVVSWLAFCFIETISSELAFSDYVSHLLTHCMQSEIHRELMSVLEVSGLF